MNASLPGAFWVGLSGWLTTGLPLLKTKAMRTMGENLKNSAFIKKYKILILCQFDALVEF